MGQLENSLRTSVDRTPVFARRFDPRERPLTLEILSYGSPPLFATPDLGAEMRWSHSTGMGRGCNCGQRLHSLGARAWRRVALSGARKHSPVPASCLLMCPTRFEGSRVGGSLATVSRCAGKPDEAKRLMCETVKSTSCLTVLVGPLFVFFPRAAFHACASDPDFIAAGRLTPFAGCEGTCMAKPRRPRRVHWRGGFLRSWGGPHMMHESGIAALLHKG